MKRERYYGIDLLRLACFVAIAVFHITYIHWHTSDIAIAGRSLILGFVDIYARSFAFAGFAIMGVSCFLIGLAGKSVGRKASLLAFIFLAWVGFSATMYLPPGTYLAWDVYPLVLIGLASAFIAERFGILNGLGILGTILLCIPFWEFGSLGFGAELDHVLGFAPCSRPMVEWTVFPWIGLPWLTYWLGHEARERLHDCGTPSFEMGSREFLIWGSIGVLTLPSLGAYFGIRLGPYFACDAYRQTPIVFWSHFFWITFICRLAISPEVQNWFAAKPLFRWFGSLKLCSHFWLAYFVHYILAHLLSWIVTSIQLEQYSFHDRVIEAIAILYLPLTEGICRLLLWGRERIANNVTADSWAAWRLFWRRARQKP